jgi:hypothetical protein
MQSTSDDAPGLLAYVEHHLGAHHSPDVCHVQHELIKAVSGPMASKQRAAAKAAHEAQERCEQAHQQLGTTDAPQKHAPGRPPQGTASLEQLEQDAQAARQELERISGQREQVARRIRHRGQAYHVVDVESGVRRNGRLIAADIHTQIDTMRRVAPQHEGLSQTCLERLNKAQRVVPKMQATILPETQQSELKQQANELAEVFQRSSANVEGRNGYLSLRTHQLRGLDRPRKGACLTAMHNFFRTRADGTTAAERFFGQKPRSMFAAISQSVDLPPAPLSPPRRAEG